MNFGEVKDVNKKVIISGGICATIGVCVAGLSLTPAFRYYSIIGPIVGAMFVVAGVVLGIYGALKGETANDSADL